MATNRIWLRLPDDNPIWDVPSELRSKIADEWLRQGANMQNLTELVRQLNQHVSHLGQVRDANIPSITDKPAQLPSDKSIIAQNLIKSFDLFT